jgi:hypothetical protein
VFRAVRARRPIVSAILGDRSGRVCRVRDIWIVGTGFLVLVSLVVTAWLAAVRTYVSVPAPGEARPEQGLGPRGPA